MGRVLGLEPDLIVAVREENSREDVETLAEAGVPVFLGAPETVDGALQMLRELAATVEAPQAQSVLAPIERVVKRLEMRRGDRRRVFVPIWKSPYMGVGSDTYVHDVLEVSGGENVCGRADPLPRGHAAGDRSAAARGRTATRRALPLLGRGPARVLRPGHTRREGG